MSGVSGISLEASIAFIQRHPYDPAYVDLSNAILRLYERQERILRVLETHVTPQVMALILEADTK